MVAVAYAQRGPPKWSSFFLAIRTGSRMAQDGLGGGDGPQGGPAAERTLDNRRAGRMAPVCVATNIHDSAGWNVRLP